MNNRRAPVAIVGAGFAGTMVAANLARRGIASLLVESEPQAGQGAAYSTGEPAHLLNIPAETMGAWADSPEDFLLREGVERGSYAERRRFGRYLRAILDDSIAGGHVDVVAARAVGAERTAEGWRVALDSGDTLQADALVLATGNQRPAAIPGIEPAGERLIDNPWGERARAAIAEAAERNLDVLILGTSLTMIDVALSLDSAGHKGRAVALSRRGKIPLANGPEQAVAAGWEDLPVPKVRAIARWLRGRSREIGWRPAVDSLRPHSHRLWQAMASAEKRLFLRRGRPWWDIHRHRIAPEIAGKVDTLIASGRLEVIAGSLLDVRADDHAIEVTFRRRGTDVPQPTRRFGYVFNCTGPLGDIGRTEEPLLRQLLDDGAVLPDELAIGLEVDGRSRAGPAGRVWALGTLTKGRYWEIIAVPDIRVQAAEVAEDIATELGR